MSLPKLTTPYYEIILPSETNIKYRPFVLGEQKLLLIASEGGDTKEILDTIKAVVSRCVQTPNFDVNEIPSFDLEWLFMHIRAKSVNEILELNIPCEKCEKSTLIGISINDDVSCIKNPEHTNMIKINDTITVEMKYPTPGLATEEIDGVSDIEADMWLIKYCIKSIHQGDNTHIIDNNNIDELDEFINSLLDEQYNKILDFFNTSPKVTCTKQWTCSHGDCNTSNNLIVSGLSDFFI